MPDARDRDAFGDRRLRLRRGSAPERVDHAGVALDLHADDVDVGAPALGRDRDAGHEPAAADGHDDRVDVGDRVDDLEADGALARDDRRVVERGHERGAGVGRQLERGRERAGEVGAREHHLGFVDLGARDLGERRVGGHDDGRRDPEPVGVVGEALRVVAGRRGHDPFGPVRLRQRQEEVEGAPFLERRRELQVLELQRRPGRP